MRNGSAVTSRNDSGHAVGTLPAVVASAVEEEGSVRFSSGVLRKNLKGFHLLRSSFMSFSLPLLYTWISRVGYSASISHGPPTAKFLLPRSSPTPAAVERLGFDVFWMPSFLA